jgi:hypothetical protein
VLGSIAMVVGVVVNALPDRGESIVSLGSEHGLSGQDLVGVAILLAGWLVVAREIWVRRDRVLRAVGEREKVAATFAAGLGLGLLFASLFNEWTWWWMLAVALLVAVQVRALALALKP